MNKVEQIYTSCLAQGSYFVESDGEAFVVDPLRESKPYLDRAIAKGVKIKYIFETHFHADFVSGHLDLAQKTGAKIIYGPGANTEFDIVNATDEQVFEIGKLKVKALHTPGHTPESTCYLLINEEGKDHALFTGDTLFIGDVGRPDLAQKATNLTQEDLAEFLFDSLRNKILPLSDEVIVYPAHGAGSACGKNMSSETWDYLGNQKKSNYALRGDMSKEEFVKEVTDGLLPPPQYFSKNAMLNKKGYKSLDSVMESGLRALEINEFKELVNKDSVLLLDVRSRWDFVEGFVPGSLFIGLDGSFAPWVGALIHDIDQKIVLVAPNGKEEEAVRRLARVGYDQSIGYLKGGFEAWEAGGERTDKIQTEKVEDFVATPVPGKILDVRKPTEYETTHVVDSISLPLDFFPDDNMMDLDRNETYHLHCRSGFRSTIAASILKQKGFKEIVNVIGNFDDIKASSLPVEGNCPSLVG